LHGTKKKFNNFELGKEITNETYGKVIDNGLGIFFTDNETMAKYFAGVYRYSDNEIYEYIPNKSGYLVTAEITMNKTLKIENLQESFEDSIQQYFALIEKVGGADKLREILISEGFDSIKVSDATTNYYEDNTYDVYVVLDPKNCKIIKTEEIGNKPSFDVNNFKIVAEKTYNKWKQPTGAIYTVNGIEICRVKKYGEDFCSRGSRGEPSNIRDTRKMAYETNWSYSGIEKLTGLIYDKNYFKDDYPDTTWGYVGSMISMKDAKDRIIGFINSK